MRRRRFRVAVAAIAAFAAMGLAGCLVLTATTRYTERELSYMGRPGDPVPPRWTSPCWRFGGAFYVLPCGRVEGVVVYRERQDPDGDGDIHGLAVAGRRLVILKSARGSPAIPGAGGRVDLAGVTMRGRFGLTVVDARGTSSWKE